MRAIRPFFAELRRRRVFRVAAAYCAGALLVIEAANNIFPALELPSWATRLVVVLAILGLPVALLLAWAFDVTPAGIVRTSEEDARNAGSVDEGGTQSAADRATHIPGPPPARPSRAARGRLALLGSGSVLTLAAFAVYATVVRSSTSGREAPITSVAVLPFSNLSRDPENEYFSDGLADELLDHLAKVPGLRVAARTSSFYFKGKDLDAKEIAGRLEVEAVLEGSVQRVAGRIRLTVQLISGRTGYHLWSQTYDREAGDLFAVEDEISRAIASALRATLAGGAPTRVYVPDSAAHDLYLRGRFLFNRGSRADLRRSIELFQQAIERDSAYPDPYAAAATAWANVADAYVAPFEAYPKAEALAQRALALDESNAEAHADLALCRMSLRWDWAGAEREFRRALELNPRNAATHQWYSIYFGDRGDLRRALAESREAVRLEPFSAYYASWLVSLWSLVGEADSALAADARLQEVAPGYVYAGSAVAGAYRLKGGYAEALRLD